MDCMYVWMDGCTLRRECRSRNDTHGCHRFWSGLSSRIARRSAWNIYRTSISSPRVFCRSVFLSRLGLRELEMDRDEHMLVPGISKPGV